VKHFKFNEACQIDMKVCPCYSFAIIYVPMISQHSELDRGLILETTGSRLPGHAWSKGEHGLCIYDQTPFTQIADKYVGLLSSYRFTVDFILLTITQHCVMELSEVSTRPGGCMVIFLSWSLDTPWEELWPHFAPLILLWVTSFVRWFLFIFS